MYVNEFQKLKTVREISIEDEKYWNQAFHLWLADIVKRLGANPIFDVWKDFSAHSPSGHANGTSSTVEVPQARPVATEVAPVIEGPAPPLPPDVVARDDQASVSNGCAGKGSSRGCSSASTSATVRSRCSGWRR